MNSFKTWFAENRLQALTAGIFLLVTVILGWLAFYSWSDYSAATQSLADNVSKLSSLEKHSPSPTEQNLVQLKKNIQQEQADLNSLLVKLQASKIAPFGDLQKTAPQDRPQVFQDALRSQVTSLKNQAVSAGVTLPEGFYLGLGDYENHLPSAEEVMSLATQLTAFDWLAWQLASHQGLSIKTFDRIRQPALALKSVVPQKGKNPSADKKDSAPWVSLGSIRVEFRCDQASLRDIINALSSAPCFLVIDSFSLQNSALEPPRRESGDSAQPDANAASPGEEAARRLPVIVGREQIDVSMRVRIIDFADISQSQAPSKP